MTLRAVALAALALIPLTASAQGTVPSVVRKAAAQNESSLGGTVVNERHIAIHVNAGPAHYDEQNDALVVMKDGAFERLRYTRVVRNGRTFESGDLAQRNDEINSDFARGTGFFKQPYDRRYFDDYVYGDQLACRCTANESQITFRSVVRDDQHGDGTMRIDNATGRVVEVVYTPNVLPNHANSATTTESFGEAAPGIWTIVRIERTYGGRVAFVRGSGRVVETLDHFRHFPSIDAGFAFLRSVGD